MSEFIGIIHGDGDVEYPDKNLWGAEYSFPPMITRTIAHNRFVVLGITPPPDFDVEAAIAALQGKPAADAAPKALKGTPVKTGKETDVAESEGTK